MILPAGINCLAKVAHSRNRGPGVATRNTRLRRGVRRSQMCIRDSPETAEVTEAVETVEKVQEQPQDEDDKKEGV